jgi:hypothetical protein
MISGQVPVRQKHVHDTWAARDLPVLDATIGLLEHSYMVTVTDIATKTGLDPSVVAQALDALDPVYIDFRKTTTGGDPRFWYVFKATPEARRAVGQWPTAEALASRLADELASAAQREDNGERQALLAYAARLIGDTLRDATVRAAGAVLAPAFGGIPVPEAGQPVPPPPPRPDRTFESLVPLPELPELLRPEHSPEQDDTGSVAAQPEAPPPAEEPPPPAEPPPLTAPAPDPASKARATAARELPPVVPDLNPWPEPPEHAEAPGAAPNPDAADTDLDLVQARPDAV